jgi:hypothetical protein
MPNWCDNSLTLTHSEKTKLDELEAELSKENDVQLFQHLRSYEGEWDYGWCCENWGTKWEARIIGWERIDETTMFVSFETAWGPPIALYEFLEENEWSVEGLYNESGMCFAGIYEDGSDSYYEYADLSADEIEENIPALLEDTFGMAQYKRDWEEEEEENE